MCAPASSPVTSSRSSPARQRRRSAPAGCWIQSPRSSRRPLIARSAWTARISRPMLPSRWRPWSSRRPPIPMSGACPTSGSFPVRSSRTRRSGTRKETQPSASVPYITSSARTRSRLLRSRPAISARWPSWRTPTRAIRSVPARTQSRSSRFHFRSRPSAPRFRRRPRLISTRWVRRSTASSRKTRASDWSAVPIPAR